jgi:hypothetical protein
LPTASRSTYAGSTRNCSSIRKPRSRHSSSR